VVVSFSVRVMIAGLVAFVAGGIAIKTTLWDGSLNLLPGLGLGSLGMVGGIALMAFGAWLFNREVP
jgi:hypothetical protein